MKILLDECVTKKLKGHLPHHEVFTVVEKGWSGLVNGKLMSKCVESGVDMLLTIDKNILFQQSISKYNLTVVVFDAADSKIDSLVKFIPSFDRSVDEFEKGKLYVLHEQA